MAIGLAAVTVRAALDSLWMLALLPATIGLIYLIESLGRCRGARARSTGGERAWLGRIHPFCSWVWPKPPERWWSEHPDGVRVRIEVSDVGITIVRRLPALTAREDRGPVVIPWGDVAGARSEDRGHRMPSGHTFTLHRQTDITIDVIGKTADRWPLLTEVPAAEAHAPALTSQITTGTAELPSIRIGTAPVTFVTGAADGLLDVLLACVARGVRRDPDGQRNA